MKKKIISLLLSVALVLCAVSLPIAISAKENTGYILGDADDSGEVESVDVTYIQRYCADMTVNVGYDTLIHGDVDSSGELEITDATFIQRYLADMMIMFPIGEFVGTNQPTEPTVTDPTFIVDRIIASAGEMVTVYVNVRNNPGILGMTLTLSYDSSVLTLTNALSGSAVNSVLAFTKPGRYTNPCNFTWDGIEMDESQIKDGEILVLTFEVASDARDGVYPITLSYDDDSIFDKDLSPVDFGIINGSITVGSASVEPTTAPAQPGTEAPIIGSSVVVEQATASAGETVDIAVNVNNNPGILGMTLTLTYDSSMLTLKNAVSGSAVSDVLAFTKPGRFSSPCNFTWDGIEISDDQIKDGELLILTFEVSADAAKGTYPITISYDEDGIINSELLPVDVAIVNGSITVK